MKKIVVVGAGRVGVAVATLLSCVDGYEVLIIDSDGGALNTARGASATHDWSSVKFELCLNTERLEETLRREEPFAVVCCTPFKMNIAIAGICARLNCHYVDFTEDVSVTKAVTELNPSRSTFVLQTGLAPGLVTCVGKMLLDKLRKQGIMPTALHMRVGALPLVAEMPAAYAITWSTAGLINEYLQPVEQIVDGVVVVAGALDDHEELIVNGERLEAFNTSGGLGNVDMYAGLITADYKTVRYPGHLDFLQKRVMAPIAGLEGTEKLAKGIEIADALFPRTRDDVVYMVVRARGVSATGTMHEAAFQHKFYGSKHLTALEFTTAGTGAAVVELLGQLPNGIVFGGNVTLEQLVKTQIGSIFLEEVAEAV